jgi:uncharacterized protein (TIGR02145 family)
MSKTALRFAFLSILSLAALQACGDDSSTSSPDNEEVTVSSDSLDSSSEGNSSVNESDDKKSSSSDKGVSSSSVNSSSANTDSLSSEKVETSSSNKMESSSSSGKAVTESSSSAEGNNDSSVKFVDGIIWTPEYGKRARTFFNTVGEESFLDESTRAQDSSGWWYTLTDYDDDGDSKVELTFASTYMNALYTLKYNNWHSEPDGRGGLYFAPAPYPYASVGFTLSPDGKTVDISSWDGLCITYSTQNSVEVEFVSSVDAAIDNASYRAILPGTLYIYGEPARVETVNLSFASEDFTRPDWLTTKLGQGTVSGPVPSLAETKKNMLGLRIKYSNDEAKASCTNGTDLCPSEKIGSVRIFKIGLYGKCDDGASTLPKSSSSVVQSSSSQVSAKIMPAGTYDCSEYNCVNTDYLNENVDYGEFLDTRDNQVYKTVKVAGRVWLAQNLNYADSSQSSYLKGQSWCFDGLRSNCATYGRIYSWSATMGKNEDECGYGHLCGLGGGKSDWNFRTQGVCPEGWFVPSYNDWKSLVDTVGDSWYRLIPESPWSIVAEDSVPMAELNQYGFTALPAGYRVSTSYERIGSYAYWWTSREEDAWTGTSAMISLKQMSSDRRRVGKVTFATNKENGKNYSMYVRCVTD